METTSFWGTNRPNLIESAIEKALKEIGPQSEKESNEEIKAIRWRTSNNIEIVAGFYPEEITCEGTGNYVIIIGATDPKKEYQKSIKEVYSALLETLPQPINNIFTRIAANAGNVSLSYKSEKERIEFQKNKNKK